MKSLQLIGSHILSLVFTYAYITPRTLLRIPAPHYQAPTGNNTSDIFHNITIELMLMWLQFGLTFSQNRLC